MHRKAWLKVRNLVPLLTIRRLPLVGKSKLYSGCVCSVMLYENETWPVKKEFVIRLENNEAKMVRWICNVRPVDRFLQRSLELN